MTQAVGLDDDHPYRHPWLGVEVRHLATLIAVARTRSFRQAAVELGYVQSAVSQQISNLEHAVGASLVARRRGKRTVTLTPAGEVLLARSLGIIGQLRAARIDVAATGRAVVRLAVASDAAPLLGRLLPRVIEELPAVRLRVTETADGGELAAALERGSADVGIGSPAAADARLSSATLAYDPFVVLAPESSDLARQSGITSPDQLAGQRLIVAASALTDAQLRAAGVRLERVIQVPLAAGVPPLVAAGIGVGLVPRSDAGASGHGLVTLSTAGLIAPRHVVLCWHEARRTAVIEAFCAVALDAAPPRLAAVA